MRKLMTVACGLALVCGLSGAASAQRGTVAKGPDPAVVSDAELEKESLHNLEVARHYFKQKKAYYASYKRADEMIAGHPEFSRLDEALYIAAMSGLYLAEGKGKQKVPQLKPDEAEEFKPEVLRQTARAHLARLVRDFPASKFRKDAAEALEALGGAAPASGAAQGAPNEN
ncbi:MAG TPA: hypothetical protein VEY09_02310 [Pyrinomonadaceae bacterium]|nr:hypothetical protein [Pyrinomonadaceae bacterium]